MKKTIPTFIRSGSLTILLALLCNAAVMAQTIRYVNASASGANNGTSWANAYTSLTTALNAANAGSGQWELRVAQGNYLPTNQYGGVTRNRTFGILRAGIKLLGGYNASTGLRDPASNITYLSGGDNTPAGNYYHVMVIAGIEESATDSVVVDGFTIRYGNGTDGVSSIMMSGSLGGSAIYDNQGSGIFVTNLPGQNVAIRQCTISNNQAENGGGLYIESTKGISIEGCTFTADSATYGGAIFGNSCSPQFVNCTFQNNNAASCGGLLITNEYNDGSGMVYPTLVDSCTFTNNKSYNSEGGAMSLYSIKKPVISHSNFTGNSAMAGGGGAIVSNGCSPALSYCSFSNNTSYSNGGAVTAVNGYQQWNGSNWVYEPATLSHCTFTGNSSGGGGGAIFTTGNFYLSSISHCSFTGNSATDVGGAVFTGGFTDSSFTMDSTTFINNTTNQQGGGMYLYNNSSMCNVNGSTFTGNIATGSGGGLYIDNDGYPEDNDATRITGCIFTDNHAAAYGGGLGLANNDTFLLSDCKILQNTAAYSGGGIHNNAGLLIMQRCVVSANTATTDNGGGIAGYGNGSIGFTDVTNCIVTGNSSISGDNGFGGGIYCNMALRIYNSTIYGNHAYQGGGVGISNFALTSRNNIIWGNTGTVSAGIWRSGGSAAVTYTIVQGGHTGTGNLNTDPLFVNASDVDGADNIPGNADDGLRIKMCSPAYNSGLNSAVPAGIITDISGNTRIQYLTVDRGAYENINDTISIAMNVTHVACYGDNTGVISPVVTGGQAPYGYLWSGGATSASISGLTAGDYTLTVTDANGCVGQAVTATVNQPVAPLSATAAGQTNVSCNGGSNGTATVSATGGTASYTYSWSPSGGTGATGTGLSAGTYICTITDANACQTTQSFTITEPPALTASAASQTDVSCNGGSNGSATVNVTGGTGAYTYAWAPGGGTNATATGLLAGTYTVTITDANACQTTQSFTITQPDALLANIASQVNVSCNGGDNGSATVAATGGTGAYTYSWSPEGGTSSTAIGLAAGNYSVTITDANLCETNESVTISEPGVITGTDTQIICPWSSYTFNGVTYTSDNNTAKDTFVSVAGCDSIVTLNLTVTEPEPADGSEIITTVQVNDTAFMRTATCKMAGMVVSASDLGTLTVQVMPGMSVSGDPYVARSFDISASQPGGGTVVLYYTQDDFDDYNTLVGAGNTDFPPIGINGENLQITAFHSMPGSGNGPSGYDTAAASVEALPCTAEWNATGNRWEVTFSTSGFSGFFLHTKADGTPLPVRLKDIRATNMGTVNNVIWTTALEESGDKFEIQRSVDAKNFVTIGYQDARGIANAQYTFTDVNPENGINYYRLNIWNNDHAIGYSAIVNATVNDAKSFDIAAFPNPAQQWVSLKIDGNMGAKASVTIADVSGRVIRTIPLSSNKMLIDVEDLYPGMYFLHYRDELRSRTLKVTKQ